MPENVITPVVGEKVIPSNSQVDGNDVDVVPPAPGSHEHGESGWHYFWRELWDRLTNYYDQSQVGTNAVAEFGMSTAENPNVLNNVYEFINNANSGKTSGSFNLDNLMGNSAFQASQSLQAYYDLYQKTGNEAYLEKLFDNLYNIEQTQSARDWEKMMSDSQFSRMLEDIKSTGLNPWIALQNGVGNGSYGSSMSSAKSSGLSATSQAISEANNLRSNSSEVIGRIVSALAMLAMVAIRFA